MRCHAPEIIIELCNMSSITSTWFPQSNPETLKTAYLAFLQTMAVVNPETFQTAFQAFLQTMAAS